MKNATIDLHDARYLAMSDIERHIYTVRRLVDAGFSFEPMSDILPVEVSLRQPFEMTIGDSSVIFRQD